jgi:hypothetical protein
MLVKKRNVYRLLILAFSLAFFFFSYSYTFASLSVTHATNNSSSVTVPAHAVGDLIYISARGSSIPTLPAGFTHVVSDLNTSGTGNFGYNAAYKIALTASETSGVWSGAFRTSVAVFHSDSGDPISIGSLANDTTVPATDFDFPALALENTDGSSAVVRLHRTDSGSTGSGGIPPVGFTQIYLAGFDQMSFSYQLAVSSLSSSNYTWTPSRASHSYSVEIKETPPVLPPPPTSINLVTTDYGFPTNIECSNNSTSSSCAIIYASSTPPTFNTQDFFYLFVIFGLTFVGTTLMFRDFS